MSDRIRSSLLIAGLSLALVSSAACTPERNSDGESGGVSVTHESIQLDTDANLRGSLGGLSRALRFINESRFMGLIPIESDCASAGDDFESDCGESESFEVDLEPSVEELVEWLDENVLRDELVEDSSDRAVTYRLPAELICEGGGDTGRPTEPLPVPGDDQTFPDDEAAPDAIPTDREGGELDAECMRVLEEVPLRLQVSARREGDLDVALLVGQDRINPIKFRIYQRELAVTVDLNKGKAALSLLAAAADEEVELPEVMRGVVEASIKDRGNDTFEGAVAVLSDIEILSMSLEQPMALRVAAANPALRVVVDGQGHEITAEADLGAIDLSGALSMLMGSSETCSVDDNGDIWCESDGPTYDDHGMAFHLGGASARTTYNGETDVLVLENLGLGDTTTSLTVDEQRVLGIDVNASHGRRFDLTLSAVEGGVEVAVSPALDVAVSIDGRYMPNADELPSWAQDENLRVSFDGASSPTVFIGEEAEGLQVVAGTLKLSSDALGETVVVQGGQCLLGGPEGQEPSPVQPGDDAFPVEGEDEEAVHPFEGLEAGVCQ